MLGSIWTPGWALAENLDPWALLKCNMHNVFIFEFIALHVAALCCWSQVALAIGYIACLVIGQAQAYEYVCPVRVCKLMLLNYEQ